MTQTVDRPPAEDRSNRLSVTRAGGQLITDYWDDLFTAREQGKQIVWYNGGAVNPFFQAAGIAWCHGEAFAARLAAQQLEGPAQLAGVLSIVARAAAEGRGQVYDEEADKGMREFVEASVEEQSLPFFLSGMLYDDGVIDPRDTRTVLAICLSVIENRPIAGTDRFGVFRM